MNAEYAKQSNYKMEPERVRRTEAVEREAFALLLAGNYVCDVRAGAHSTFVDPKAVEAAVRRSCEPPGGPGDENGMEMNEIIAKSLLLLKL